MRIQHVLDDCFRQAHSVLTFYGPDGSVSRTSFGEIGARARSLAARLSAAGLRDGHVVGVEAENHPDWVVWDVALASLGALVRAYPSDPTRDAPASAATDDLALFVRERSDDAGSVPLSPEAFDPSRLRGDARRAQNPDLHSIVYSSGTTGREKVLMISRAGASDAIGWFCGAFPVGPEDRHLVFLPLANFQQRQQVFTALHRGVNLILCGYTQAMRAVRAERPTFLLAPPALYENMLSVAEQGVPLADLYGGAVRFLITGMAPIKAKVLAAYWEAGLPLLEGYGLTECGIIACNTLEHSRPGTVGRLVDPGSFGQTEEGEILIRQHHPLSLGYLGAEDLNAETFLPDGSVRTGDIGHLDADGFLKLEGRVKDMIALPSGRKLHPADLEQLLLLAPGVQDAVAVDNGSGVTAVLRVSGPASKADIRAALRAMPASLDAAGAVTDIIFTDIPLNANPLFSTANMKLNRRLVGRHFLGRDARAS